MKFAVILAIPVFLAACDAPPAIKTFSDATADVNEGYALGQRLRDRCASTNDIDDCSDWIRYKSAAEAKNGLLDYDKGLARWEANGPY